MSERPSLQFLSLFVPNLDAARRDYAKVFGLEPVTDDPICLKPHPFAAAGPVVFDLGTIKIALYQCDQRGTHPGDVGIGIQMSEPPEALANRAREVGANVFVPPRPLPGTSRKLCVFMMPDRHFFEVVAEGNKPQNG